MVRPGYAGKMLRVDLSTGKATAEDLPPTYYDLFLGGRGFGSRLLFELSGPDKDPLAPESPLIFTPGALHGTPVPAASRSTLTFKSLLSGGHGDAHSGGFFGAELKYAGYDLLLIEGRADKPVWLYIRDGRVSLEDASDLWGLTVPQVQERIKARLGMPDVRIACIGPAGEHLVRYASVTDGEAVFARCGGGAVMGSKNLKAVVVRGTGGLEVANQDLLWDAFCRYDEAIHADPYCPPATRYGTPRFMSHRVLYGIHGACNWRYGEFNWKPLGPDVFRNRHTIKAASCPMCLMRCRRTMMIRDGLWAGTFTKVEWESIARSMTCGIDDSEEVIRTLKLYNDLGVDVESGGDTIAFAMECYEKGLLTKADTDGIELAFGDVDVVLELLRKIAYREGIGDLLADGSLRAARQIGRGAEAYAMQVKGVEMSAGDPRGMPVRAVSYATSTRGSDHLRSNPYVEEIIDAAEGEKWFGSPEAADLKGTKGKGRLLKWSEDLVTIGDLLGLCKFAYYRSASLKYLRRKGLDLAASFYRAVTGREVSADDLLVAGERTFNVEKAFNVRHGMDREQDTIPERFFREPIEGGASHGAVVDREKYTQVLEEYYQARGWDVATGLPKRDKLESLGLGDIAVTLAAEGKLSS